MRDSKLGLNGLVSRGKTEREVSKLTNVKVPTLLLAGPSEQMKEMG